VGATGAVGADQHRLARPPPGPVPGELRQSLADHTYVVRSSVRAGVALSEHHRQRLTRACLAVIGEGQQRVEPEAFLECRGRQLLVRVRRDQGGVDVDHHRVLRVGGVVGGVLTRAGPHPGPGRRPRGVDRRQRAVGVAGEGVDQPRHSRIRGHRTEHRRLRAQHRDIGQAVTAHRQRNRQIGHDLARIMPSQRLPPRSERLRQHAIQAGGADRLDQRHRPCLRDDPGLCRVDLDTRIQPDTLHPEGAPSYADSVTRHLRFLLAWSTFQLITTRSPRKPRADM